MAGLRLSFLGPFQAFVGEKLITGFDSNKTRALLVYLAVEAIRPHSREMLAALLWPDRPQISAINSLRNALAVLRKVIGDSSRKENDLAQPPFLHITRDTIQFNLESDVWVDVGELEKTVNNFQFTVASEQQTAVCGLRSAVDLHRGDFLEGFYLAGSPEFEQWILAKRQVYRDMAMELLRSLAVQVSQTGEYSQALVYTRRMLDLEPWDEAAHRQAMLLLAFSGHRSAALSQYHACRKALQEELGVEPDEETTLLYQQISSGAGLFTAEVESQLSSQIISTRLTPSTSSPLFVARHAELVRLDEALRRALAGQGQVIFISGSPGSGKTALAQAFIRRALLAHPNLVVIMGRCQAYFGQGDPYLPFREAFEMLTGKTEDHLETGMTGHEYALQNWRSSCLAIQTLVEEGPALVETFLPGAALLERANQAAGWIEHNRGKPCWLTRLEEIVSYRQQPPSGEHTGLKLHSEQEALFYQYSNVLHTLARHFTLILFLDDLQWADTGSLSLLFTLVRKISGTRILIVGAYRGEEIQTKSSETRHPLSVLLNEFRLLFPDQTINLDEVEEQSFIDEFLDSQPNCLGTAFREMLFHQTRSHSLYTVELLRGMQERRELVRNQNGKWVERSPIQWDILPDRVEAAITERIGRLPQALIEILQAASVEGEVFTVEVLTETQESDPRKILKNLSEVLDRRHQLVRAEGVVRIDGQRLSRYSFRHILFQKYLYNRLDPVMRSHLHERVGAALERLYTEQAGEVAGQLSRHFEQAGLFDKAVHYLSVAAKRAASQAANQEAIAYFTHALELTPENDLQRQFELILERWRILYHTSQPERQAQDVQDLEKLAKVLGPAYQARAAICHLHDSIDVVRDEQGIQFQVNLVQSAIDWSREAGKPDIESEACIFQANLFYHDPALILPAYERGLRLARQAGLKGLEADIYQDMAINRFIADNQRRIEFGEQAVQLYRQVGDRHGEGKVLGLMGVNYRWLGDFARALSCFEQARNICSEVGNRLNEMFSILGVALAYNDAGRPQGQAGILVEALENVRATHVSWLEFQYLVHISELFLSEGDASQSLAYAEQTRRFYEHSSSEKRSVSEVMGLYSKGRALLDLARLEEAGLAFRQCIEIAKTSQHRDLFIGSPAVWADLARSGLAAVLLRQGDPQQALETIEKKWGKIQEYDFAGGWTSLIFYRVFHANGDPRADLVLVKAYQGILKRSSQISDEEMRRSFLENIPENRDIRALWRQRIPSRQGSRDFA